jgi:predicted nucleotidyltransferase
VERGLQHSAYRVNRDHVLWPSIELALDANRELDRRIAAFVEASGEAVESVAVFGSLARGTATGESDVDLVVVFHDQVDADLVGTLGEQVRAWTGNACHVFDVTRADLARFVAEGDPLVGSWRADARTLYGKDLREIL